MSKTKVQLPVLIKFLKWELCALPCYLHDFLFVCFRLNSKSKILSPFFFFTGQKQQACQRRHRTPWVLINCSPSRRKKNMGQSFRVISWCIYERASERDPGDQRKVGSGQTDWQKSNTSGTLRLAWVFPCSAFPTYKAEGCRAVCVLEPSGVF